MNPNLAQKQESAREDEQWVRQFNNGNEMAFSWLLHKYKDMVFNLCFRFLGNMDDANECAQETFVKVWKNLSGFRFDSQFSTWLYRIALNNCKNKVKSLEYRLRSKTTVFNNISDGVEKAQNQSHELEAKQLAEKLQSCIAKLHKIHRELVVLRNVEGVSYEEISKITKQNVGTIKSRLARARDNLRICLEGFL